MGEIHGAKLLSLLAAKINSKYISATFLRNWLTMAQLSGMQNPKINQEIICRGEFSGKPAHTSFCEQE